MYLDEFVEHCYALGILDMSRTAERVGGGDNFWIIEMLWVYSLARICTSVINIVNYHLLLSIY